MLVLGIDAGGSKALFAVADERGHVLRSVRRPGLTPAHMNEAELAQALHSGADELRKAMGLPPGSPEGWLCAVCIGMPCLGESDAGDEMVLRAAHSVFSGIPTQIVNDAQVAWAGSFAMQPGINVVCGTGTISFGVDAAGNSARCGGWSYHFSDEGSGYWLGKKLLELFCKQSDGRISERGALYELVRERFELHNDFEIIDIAERDYIPYRDKVASLQLLLHEAASRGDLSAIACYDEAAREIALNIQGILTRLHFEGAVRVSYSGGIFNAGELVMRRFRDELARLNCTLAEPVAPPYIGALMMALRRIGRDGKEAIDQLIMEGKQPC